MRRLAISLAALSLAACSGNPSLPTRQIDHPFTLPSDTSAFTIGGEVQLVKGPNAAGSTAYFNVPGGWRAPINDHWTWEVPTMLSHQFQHDDLDTFGLRFGLHSLGYATTVGWFFHPGLSLYQKHKFTRDFALETKLGGIYSVRTRSESKNGWRTYLELAPLFQLDDTKSLSAKVAPTLENKYAHDFGSRLSLIATRKTELTLPVGSDFHWRLSQSWETQLGYTFRRIGYDDGYRSHDILLAFTNYW